MTKRTKMWIYITAGAILCAVILFLAVRPAKSNEEKKPEMYTWEEYQMMSLEEQDELFDRFGSVDTFEAWLNAVRPQEPTIETVDWDEVEKLPSEYTWEEYLALSAEDRESFFQWFESEEAFYTWRDSVAPDESVEPTLTWDKKAKDPNKYTWEEYLALNSDEQEAFFQWFESVHDFEAWMETVKPSESVAPDITWDKSGKQPDEYTWEEYQALANEEKDAFAQWFDSERAFEKWRQAAMEKDTVAKWNKEGKKPNEYTWGEFQMLPPEEQDAFYLWFSSRYAFEVWMKDAKPQENGGETQMWDKGGKMPNEYTWEEYQNLTYEEQDAFYLWFESKEAFEAWMNAAMGS